VGLGIREDDEYMLGNATQEVYAMSVFNVSKECFIRLCIRGIKGKGVKIADGKISLNFHWNHFKSSQKN
jgi:hypothetical protein